MKSEPDREEGLFQAAAQLRGTEQVAFLKGACHGDPNLRRRLEARLGANDQDAGSAPTAATPEFAATVIGERARSEEAGLLIGRYKLLEKLGEGGFGTVWLAEQKEPVRRKVALKIIKLGMDTKQVVARFEAERQALAMIDHPNIAKVLDAGTTEQGRPYFVMELVRGIPITQFCEEQQMPTRTRLDLFIKVCQAIQHAHQKGIIHRDINGPASVLVDLSTGRETHPNLPGADNAAFSPDGKLLAAASSEGHIVMWETATERAVATLHGFLMGIHTVTFSPDGKRLAAGSDGKEAVKLWDIDILQELLTLEGEGSFFMWSAFTANGNVLGVMNRRGMLHLWRAPSWEEIGAAEAKEKAENTEP